jgi:hypothetical protein
LTHINRTCIRSALAVATGLVIYAGHNWVIRESSDRRYNLVFFGVLIIALLPAAIYALRGGAHGTIPRGVLILTVTGASWLVVVVSRNDFGLVYPIMAWLATLAIALWPNSRRPLKPTSGPIWR